jgi:hypothetical protein
VVHGEFASFQQGNKNGAIEPSLELACRLGVPT